MKRSRRSNRRYARPRSLPAAHGAASRLAERAGLSPRAAVEQLETRQLLFSLTITPNLVNPDTGVGTIFAQWGYVLPYLTATTDVQIQAPEVDIEDFSDEEPMGNIIGGGGNVNSGRFLNESDWYITHNINPGANIRIVSPFENGQPQTEEAVMLVRLNQGQRVTLRPAAIPNSNAFFLSMNNLSIDFGAGPGSAVGLNLANTRVELRFEGQLVGSFTGAELGALNTTAPGTGVGTFVFASTNPNVTVFNQIDIIATGGPNDAFTMDNLTRVTPAGNFAELIDSRVFIAEMAFTGPVGATVRVLDSYGREMFLTTALGSPNGASNFVIVDPDDNGVPNFNDGIGRIVMFGTDGRSQLTVAGGTIEDGVFSRPDSIAGIFDDFEEAGFGFFVDPEGGVVGLPPGPGSVIIGNPYLRDNTNTGTYNPAGGFLGNADFLNPDHGIFVTDGSDMGVVYINGAVFGNNRFNGYLDRYYAGYQLASMSVKGDLGAYIVGSDAGAFEIDPDNPIPGINTTPFSVGTQLIVSRTVGQIIVAGRLYLDVTVAGNLVNPTVNHPRDIARYYELEHPYQIPPGTPNPELVWLGNMFNSVNYWANSKSQAAGEPFRAGGQAPIMGELVFRNDHVILAEWVGSVGTAVQIYGNLNGGDTQINTNNDRVDVYGFAADGTQEVVIEVQDRFLGAPFPIHVRVVDHNGRTVASIPTDVRAQTQNIPIAGLPFQSQSLRFTPPAPGTYYLVLDNLLPVSNPAIEDDYVVLITGMASTTLGSIQTGAQFGDDAAIPPAITVLGGSMGALRTGTGIGDEGGQPTDPLDAYNDDETEYDTRMEWKNSTVSVIGSLYGMLAGGDIEGSVFSGALVIVSGDLGSIATGLNPDIDDIGRDHGDIGGLDIRVGGRIGFVDVHGAIAIDQDNQQNPDLATLLPFSLRSGTRGNGDIGMIRVGEHVFAGLFSITTSPGSTIGALLISQDALDDDAGTLRGIYGPGVLFGTGLDVTTGFGSDVRFVDFPRIDQAASVNAQLPIVGGQTLELVDDAGGRVTISITGVPGGVTAGFVRVLPIDGSQGVAIAQIDADLTGGRALVITGEGQIGSQDRISIGRINIIGGDAGSAVRILGGVETDIWQISQSGGDAFGVIINETPRGDIVAIDVASLTTLTMLTGDLGRTTLPAFGPKRIGPFIGIAETGGEDAFGPFGIGFGMPADWNGEMYRPVTDIGLQVTNAYLDDIGSPIDPYLDGLRVRTGTVTDVQVGGAIGDVLIQNGDLTNLIADFDLTTPQGQFHGIIGNIFASGDIGSINVGDGLARRTQSPLATTSIVAGDDILQVLALNGASLSSLITAFNQTTTGAPEEGVVNITISGGGDIADAYISAEDFDGFWVSHYGWPSDGRVGRGNIFNITGIDADLFRTEMFAARLVNMTLTNGFWDASVLATTTDVSTVTVSGFRNSTLQGTGMEFFPNTMIIGRNLGTVTAGGGSTIAGAGEMADLHIDVLGSIAGGVFAHHISRSIIDADNTITAISVTGDIRASEVNTGRLLNLTAAHNIRSSRFNISGPVLSFTAGDEIYNTELNVTGPDGRIDLVSARTFLSGSIQSSGPIGTVQVTQGDMEAFVGTTTERGDVTLLTASRDLNIRTDIAGNLAQLTAGRHIGQINSVRTILVHGDLQSVDVSHGQLYSDIRIGEDLAGTATIGPAFNRPGITDLGHGSIIAFGAINTVRTLGDFGGQIISYSGGITLVSINDGSLLPEARIAAFDGDIRNVVINRGHLLGDIHADYILWAINVNASSDGIFGSIGVSPALNPNTPYSEHRNQLPPGVIANSPIQGPRITAGRNIGRITTSSGSMYETLIYAARAIGTITINGNVQNDALTGGLGTQIIAGSSIFRVIVNADLRNTAIAAGVSDLGADGRLGGTGLNIDQNQSGRIGTVDVAGDASNSIITAGLVAGADGLYNTPDDGIVPGLSFVRNVLIDGGVSNVSVFSDWPVLNGSPGLTFGGTNAPPIDPRIIGGVPAGSVQLNPSGASATFTTQAGEVFTVQFTGNSPAARAYWDAANNRIALINTNHNSILRVVATPPAGQPKSLTDFRIATNDDASVNTISVDANLLGDSYIVVDNNVVDLQFNNGAGTDILAGGNFRNFTTGSLSEGSITARYLRTVNIVGTFGLAPTLDDAHLTALAAGAITIGGDHLGAVNINRDITSFRVNGAMRRATFRSGSNVGTFHAGSLSESRISVRDRLNTVTVGGNVDDTSIMVGGDLGANGVPGGTSVFNNDEATTGHIGSVTIGGDFTRSDIVAGLLRGPDGFFGTTDDSVAAGRSTIGSVTIGGQAFGSNFNTEQYRISSTGDMGPVTIAGAVPSNEGNFKTLEVDTLPLPIQVLRLETVVENFIHLAKIQFNQEMDASTFAAALRISEVRSSGNVLIPLTINTHYTISYDAPARTAIIVFTPLITERNLPQLPGVPGPGVYRFDLDAETLRAQVAQARLDGDFSGQPEPNDDYSDDAVVGDAGDKIVAEVAQGPDGGRVDFYAPVDLDVILDDNRNPNGVPDVNKTFRVSGFIGDHPDNDATTFDFGGDADVYKITLRAGQILHLGAQDGTSLFSFRTLLDAAGQPQFGDNEDSVTLPGSIPGLTDLTTDVNYLIKTTGTYYLVIDNAFGIFPFIPGLVPQINPSGATIGDYAFDLRIFDDGDTGFAADTDSGNGSTVATAPMSIAFAGPDELFGTGDDVTQVRVGDFTFTLDRGPDGVANTVDDVVAGTNARGVIVTRTNVDRVHTRITSAIGPEGHVGVPGDVIAPDVDIFHLNNGEPIGPNTKFTVTVKLSERGADLGSRTQQYLVDFNGAVEMGIFETTTASAVDDGLLVFSPTDFLSSGGVPGTQLAKNGPMEYGFDENGDFTMTFITPGRLGASGPASYAFYLQGVFNTDYVVEIVQQGTGNIPRVHQNIFIETRGGTLDWLLKGPLDAQVEPFRPATLGFSGNVGPQSVQTYILNNLVANLISIFNAAGVDVRVSLTPASFEFEDYSTIFLTSSNDPIHSFNELNYGASSRSDPFNTDKNDEAAVFVPSFATLGLTPSKPDLDLFIQSLTATVGRRAGELMGLRMTTSQFGGNPRDIMSVTSPENQPGPGGSYRFTEGPTKLAGFWDYNRSFGRAFVGHTQFFLGQQRSRALLDAFLAP